ncbi:MAG: type II toxin-antitoxin system VapC family toxin [Betaproteobacteria bacterium]|nr:type II toxin-antitoxin system VapC family toxin [Betaproteobacteria bacterium]
MRLLVDTHLLIWWLAGKSIPARAAELIRDPGNQIYASAVSVWEVAIKVSLGKIRINPDELIAALREGGFQELAVTGRHAARVAQLPKHHRDPFDRLLVAQSLAEAMLLLTQDQPLAAYGPSVLVAR